MSSKGFACIAICTLFSACAAASEPWWDTAWKYRRGLTFEESAGRDRADQWINVHVELDPGCADKAYEGSLRLVSEGYEAPIYGVYNVTYCPSPGFVKEIDLEMRFNVLAYSDSTYYFYYTDDESLHEVWDAGRKPVKIIWADYGSGNGPDKQAYRDALNDAGYAGFYEEYSLQSGDVPLSEIDSHPVIIWAQAMRYRYFTQADCEVLYEVLKAGASVFLEGSDIGYDVSRWEAADCVKQLLHEQGCDNKGGSQVLSVYSGHPVNRYVGPPGTSFAASSRWPDSWGGIWGPAAVEVYRWDNGRHSSTANSGVDDVGCPGSPCGKTTYLSTVFYDTGKYGIMDPAVRRDVMKGVMGWFLEPTVNVSVGYEEQDNEPPSITGARFNASSVGIGDVVRFTVNVTDDLSGVDTVSASFRYPNGSEVVKRCEESPEGYSFDWADTMDPGIYSVTRVYANDSFGNAVEENYAELFFGVQSGGMLSIDLAVDYIDFGSGSPEAGCGSFIASNETNPGGWASIPGGFVVENNGEVDVIVKVYSGETADEFIGGTDPGYLFASSNDLFRAGCTSGLQGSWADIVQSEALAGTVCSSLGHADYADRVEVNLRLYVPADAPVKAASVSTLTFIAEAA